MSAVTCDDSLLALMGACSWTMVLIARDLSWLQVPEVTQDSQGLMGNQEVEASLETLAPWGPKVHLLEIKVMGFCSIRRYLALGVDMDQ